MELFAVRRVLPLGSGVAITVAFHLKNTITTINARNDNPPENVRSKIMIAHHITLIWGLLLKTAVFSVRDSAE